MHSELCINLLQIIVPRLTQIIYGLYVDIIVIKRRFRDSPFGAVDVPDLVVRGPGGHLVRGRHHAVHLTRERHSSSL